jgi:ABC-type Fe3+/spermidine/putrescine transport system ATPase subunit
MISITKLSVNLKRFSLQDINLDVAKGDYFMLVGPTGSGKTVLIETIAGLHRLNAGQITIDNRDVTLLAPEARNIGMVHQDGVLFPHLRVSENITFGLKTRHLPGPEVKQRMSEVTELVGVGHLLDRKPGKLSGGEKQKVALARALAIRPGVLLLDEPLSALDPETRESMQSEIRRIRQQLDITVIHVTHDLDEAMVLGKHIAVIGAGRIRQVGNPDEIFRRPASEFVARFTLMRNIFRGELLSNSANGNSFRSGNLELAAHATLNKAEFACIRPDDVIISPNQNRGTANSITAPVVRIEDRGVAYHVFINGPPEICCLLTRRHLSEMDLRVGQVVTVTLPSECIHVF